MEIDPSPTRPNDELEFIELTGINDHALDQELAGLRTEGIQAGRNTAPAITKSISESVLMILARQLPTRLEFRFNRTSELEDAAYQKLLDLLDEAMQSGKYYKVRRLSMSITSLRHWNRLILYIEMLQKSPPERDQPNAPVEHEIPTCTRALP